MGKIGVAAVLALLVPYLPLILDSIFDHDDY